MASSRDSNNSTDKSAGGKSLKSKIKSTDSLTQKQDSNIEYLGEHLLVPEKESMSISSHPSKRRETLPILSTIPSAFEVTGSNRDLLSSNPTAPHQLKSKNSNGSGLFTESHHEQMRLGSPPSHTPYIDRKRRSSYGSAVSFGSVRTRSTSVDALSETSSSMLSEMGSAVIRDTLSILTVTSPSISYMSWGKAKGKWANDRLKDITFDPALFDVLEVDPKIIARQLALIDSELFKKITRSEFASIAWTKPDKQIKTPNIVEMTLHFNQVSLWVSREILSSASTKKRFLKICHFIAVAQISFEINNFNGVKSILSGLQSTPVYRLERTWAMVGRREKNVFDKLIEIVSPDNNNELYRKRWSQSKAPAVPYLGIYLSDLTFIVEAKKKELADRPDSHHLLEREKQLENILDEVERYQKGANYEFESIQAVKDAILSQTYSPELLHTIEKEQYELSFQLEPREGSSKSSPLRENVNDTLSIEKTQDFFKRSKSIDGFSSVQDRLAKILPGTGKSATVPIKGRKGSRISIHSDIDNPSSSSMAGHVKGGSLRSFREPMTQKSLDCLNQDFIPKPTQLESDWSSCTSNEDEQNIIHGEDSCINSSETDSDTGAASKSKPKSNFTKSYESHSNCSQSTSSTKPSIIPLSSNLYHPTANRLEGSLYHKEETLEDGSKSKKRKWKRVWAVLHNEKFDLYLYDKKIEKYRYQKTVLETAKSDHDLEFKASTEYLKKNGNIISSICLSSNCKVEIPTDYTKRKNVFRIWPTDLSHYLMQANEASELTHWLSALNEVIHKR